MDNLINETNSRLQEIIDNLTTIKNEYENKLEHSNKEIDVELKKVKKYKEDFFVSKQKIEKMNADIEGFEQDYQNLVDRFKDDELANILIAANKEISAKIDERKRKIARDKVAMNELVEKAESSKNKLVKLTAEKKALELCLKKIIDSYEFYTKSLSQIIEYSYDNPDNLCACFYEKSENIDNEFVDEPTDEATIDEDLVIDTDDFGDFDIEINEDMEPVEIEDEEIELEIDEDLIPIATDEDIIEDTDDEEVTKEEEIIVENNPDYEEDIEVEDEEIEIEVEDIAIEEDALDEEAIDISVEDDLEEVTEVDEDDVIDISIEDDLTENDSEDEEIEIDVKDEKNKSYDENDKTIEIDIPNNLYNFDNINIADDIDFDDSLEEENEE